MVKLGRFASHLQCWDEVVITAYAKGGPNADHNFIGLKAIVATVYPYKGSGADASSPNDVGDDGWVKFWPKEEDLRIPNGKLWLYQPRAELVHRDSFDGR